MNDLIITKLSRRDIRLESGSVAALGCFDGLHIGHRAVIKRAVEIARYKRLAAIVWTPVGMERGPLLTDEAEKRELIMSMGVDFLAEQSFDAIKGQSGEQFVAQTLFGALNVRHAVTGFNFTFGAGGKCGTHELCALLTTGNASLDVLSGVNIDGQVVASTRIRSLIEAGEVEKAAILLGRPYSIRGTVIHGRHIGHTIGIPTANLSLPSYRVLPLRGVYASEISTSLGYFRGISNVGVNPTVSIGGDARLETHLIGFDGDLYGQTITVKLLKFIRPEQQFASLDDLKAQIGEDIKTTLEVR